MCDRPRFAAVGAVPLDPDDGDELCAREHAVIPARGPKGARDLERGAGSVLVVGIAAAILLLVLATVPLGSVLAARQRAAGAADAAALAGADAAAGLVPGSPCTSAGTVAAANSARVTACLVDGSTVTVRVTTAVGGFGVDATATAGQPTG